MIWEDVGQPAQKRAKALIAAVQGRKDLKRLGKWLDDADDPALRQGLIDAAEQAGIELPDEAVGWPGKRLLRRAMGKEPEARKRTTPIARDEAFVCMYCHKAVPPHGRTARDHCPWCLRSRHVDDIPGDRASTCEGRMDPFEVDIANRDITIRYQCTRCRAEKRCRAVLDGEVPDDWDALVRLSNGTLA